MYNLIDAKNSLAAQVATGGIKQAQADNELARLQALNDQENAPITSALGLLAGKDKTVLNALLAGQQLGNQFFSEGSMGRLDVPMTEDEGRSLFSAREIMLQNPRTDQEQRAIDNLERISNESGIMNADVANALNLYKQQLGGYTDQERNLYTEEGSRGLDRSLATGMRQMQLANAGANRSGPASMLGMKSLAAQRMSSQEDLLRKLRLDEIALKAQRLNDYSAYAANSDAEMAKRKLATGTAFSEQARAQRNSDVMNRVNANVLFNNTLGQIQNRMIGSQVFNMNNKSAELAGRLGSIFSAGGFGANLEGQQQAYELGLKQIEAMKNMGGFPAETSAGESSASGSIWSNDTPLAQPNNTSSSQLGLAKNYSYPTFTPQSFWTMNNGVS